MGDILDFSKPSVTSSFANYVDSQDFSVPVGLDTSIISAPKKFSYDFSPQLTETIMAKNAGSIPIPNNGKETDVFGNVIQSINAAVSIKGLLDGIKTSKLQRKTMQFNLDNARKLSTARNTASTNIDNVGRGVLS